MAFRQVPFLVAAVAAIGFVYVSPVAACDCFARPTCATYWEADLAFIGDVHPIPVPTGQVTLTVVERLYGEVIEKEVTIASGGNNCSYDFKPLTRYLVFAHKAADGSWKASICGATATVASERGKAAVEEIKQALKSRVPGRVSGSVWFDEDRGERIMSGAPIAGAAIRLQDPRSTLTARTNADGEFQFSRVPPGQYLLSVAVPANAIAVPPTHVAVGANACVQRFIHPLRRE